MTMFDQAAAVTLWPSIAAAFGQTITYHRGANSVELTAIKTEPLTVEANDYGVIIHAEANDFLILASDLVISEAAITPQEDDYIEIGSSEHKIMPVGEGFFQYEDPGETIIRVNTRKVT